MKKVAIVVPVYHKELFVYEKIAIEQRRKVLGGYDTFYIVPECIASSVGTMLMDGVIKVVPNEYMNSISSYNKMMLREETYSWFLGYEYILIYQTDAFVFNDRLQYFCEMGYDYFGAPWIKGSLYFSDIETNPIYYVGNGGLSLRKVERCIEVLGNMKSDINNTDDIIPEDLFWAVQFEKSKSIAPIDVALKFSFERYSVYCYRINGFDIPFGCHQWMKYDFTFWRKFIEKEGYSLTDDCYANSIDDDINPKTNEYLIMADRKNIIVSLKKMLKSRYSENIRISIWGSGRKGEECGWFMAHNNIKIERYIDSDKNKRGREMWGVRIQSPQDIQLGRTDLVMVTPIKYTNEIANTIKSNDMLSSSIIIFYEDFLDVLRKEL